MGEAQHQAMPIAYSITNEGAEQLKEAQKDPGLVKQWARAKSEELYRTKDKGTLKFKVINDIFYQENYRKSHC